MTFDSFLSKIELQEEVKNKVLNLIDVNKDEYSLYINNLNTKNLSLNTYEVLEKKYEFDKKNFHILSIYLLAAYDSYFEYKKLGINESIFIETMKCFTRFIAECKDKTSEYYFDRGFWTYRQTNMSIFRVGIFEYELLDDCVSLHIPSDVILTRENIENSFEMFKEFISNYFPNYIDKKIVCDSWLLSIELKNYLADNSRILLFQSYFEIISHDPNALDFYEWVFKCDKNTQTSQLKEDTSLQKKLKNALINGKKIGKSLGILKKK